MNAAEIGQACHDLSLLTTFWAGVAIVAGIVAIHYGCQYFFGVKFRLPRIKAAAKRLAAERDRLKLDLEQRTVECAQLRGKMEQVGTAAQRELNRVDKIREKAESRLREQNGHVEALEAILKASTAPVNPRPGRAAPGRSRAD